MIHGRDGISFLSGKTLRGRKNMPPMSRGSRTIKHEMPKVSVFVGCVNV